VITSSLGVRRRPLSPLAVPRPTKLRGLGFRLLCSSTGAGIAVGLAFCAKHFYSAPSLSGTANGSPWLELDFCFASASCVVALGVAIQAGWRLPPARVLDAAARRVVIWFGLTILLVLVWGNALSLLTLLIAPSHALACLRLTTLARAWRSDRVWRA